MRLSMNSTLRCFDARPYSIVSRLDARPYSIMSRQRAARAAVNAPTTLRNDKEEALQSYFRMREMGETPNVVLVVDALKACTNLKDLQTGGRIHSDIVHSPELRNTEVGNSLIDMYAKCGNMMEARKVFDELQQADLASWDSLILGYAFNGESSQALDVLSKLRAAGLVPSRISLLGAVIAATGLATSAQGTVVDGKIVKSEVLDMGKALHAEAVKLGYEADVSLTNALIDMYARCGSMDDARALFEKSPQRDLVSWNSMILGYAYNGEGESGLKLFENMPSTGAVPNAVTYVAAIRACCTMAEKEPGEMVGKRVVKAGAVEKGRAVHSSASKAGCELDVHVGNTLIEMYARCGHVVEARGIFERMPQKDVVTWNNMITAHGQNGEVDHAMKVYRRMLSANSNCVPNLGTYVLALKSCIASSMVDAGKQVHEDIRRAGLESNEFLKNCLVELYSKCGNMSQAQALFDSCNQRPGLPTWNALIAGYGLQGDSTRAVELFDRLRSENQLRPDGDTFLSVLAACSQAGLADKGKAYFESMKNDFGLVPKTEHFVCMVDLLGQSNQLQEAVDVIKSMPTKEAESKLWMSLLSVCRQFKNVAIGKQAYDALMGIDSNNSIATDTMAQLYSAAGMDADAAKLRNGGTSTAIKIDPKLITTKKPSGAIVEHEQSVEISAKLESLMSQMPNEFGKFDDDSACGHSERLALGCALINTEPGTPVRLVKNLRICEECHKFYALTSSIENRAITCRDANRFHNFKDGKCSCNDFW